MTKLMLALGFKRCKSDAGIYYYHDKKTKALVIAIVYVDDVCFIGTKGSLMSWSRNLWLDGNVVTLVKPQSF